MIKWYIFTKIARISFPVYANDSTPKSPILLGKPELSVRWADICNFGQRNESITPRQGHVESDSDFERRVDGCARAGGVDKIAPDSPAPAHISSPPSPSRLSPHLLTLRDRSIIDRIVTMAAAKEEEAMMRLLLCSHGGRLVPCGPGGGLRYVGGETRALAVPRGVPFRELTAPLAEKAGAAAVTAVRYRRADEGPDEDLLVSVTSDEELAHMRDEYDRLRATRPSASFRVFVSTAVAAAAGGQQRRRPHPPVGAPGDAARRGARWSSPPPMRRVHSAQELAAGGSHSHQCFYDRRRQSCCCCCCCHRRRDLPPPAWPVRPLPSMSKNVNGARPAGGQEAAKAAMVAMEMDSRRACWELE